MRKEFSTDMVRKKGVQKLSINVTLSLHMLRSYYKAIPLKQTAAANIVKFIDLINHI
jgi:hypothetical protein